VKFLARGKGYSLFLTGKEAVLTLRKPGTKPTSLAQQKGAKGFRLAHAKPAPAPSPDVLRISLTGGNNDTTFEGTQKLPGISNYFIGNDSSKWQTNIPQYAQVQTGEVYNGVSMVYYGNQGKLEYDFRVKPGTDPSVIRLKFMGADSSTVDGNGDLQLGVDGRQITFKAPTVYQEQDGNRVPVTGGYKATGDKEVGFELKDYDKTKTLIIDPMLDYSTYLGGSNFDDSRGIAVDGSGNAYLTGNTSDSNFPITSGAFQTISGSDSSTAFITKLNSTGTELVYSTYLGGNNVDLGSGIAVDGSGNAYVAGLAESSNFPTTSGAFQTALGSSEGGNAFITKLNSTGTGLVYSTYLGGSGGDTGYGIAVDGSGNIYVTGVATSTNFPTTSGAFQTVLKGPGGNAFVTKLNPAGNGASDLVYSTYLGGSFFDEGYGIAVDGLGNAYVTGSAASSNFPTTSGAFQTTLGRFEAENAFITKLNSTGTGLVYSTYLGGSSENGDEGYGIAVDGLGNAYVTGSAASSNFPTTGGAFQTALGTSQGQTAIRNAFITKLDSNGAGLAYSTYLGGSGADGDEGAGIAVNGSGNAYVTGTASSTNFPTTSGAFQMTNNTTGSTTAFVTELNPNGSGLVYSTYLGGTNSDSGFGIAVDGSENAYVTGFTTSSNFPTTSGAFQTAIGGSETYNAFITKFDASDFFTPTLTYTNTATNTPTYSPAITPTFTITNTPTVTGTASNTCTNTPTATPTLTATNSATSTATNTTTTSATATLTATSTPTLTATMTATKTATSTLTNTRTETPTKTPTETATRTATKTVTKTPTKTATSTPTRTRTETPTATPTHRRFTPADVVQANSESRMTATPTVTPGVTFVKAVPNISRNRIPIDFEVNLPFASQIQLALFNITGEEVYKTETSANSGLKKILWSLQNLSGNPVTSGLYIYVIQAANGTQSFQKTGKVVVVH
jgi:hypothetical protein